jgi:hypothetical protein
MRNAHSPLARLALALLAVFGLLAITTPAGASIDNLTIMPSPSPGANFNNLESVSCVSESWCIAVGVTDDGALVLSWDGTVWTQMTSPNPANGSQVQLNEVSCVSESFCVAVGSYDLQGTDMTLVLTWNGTSWTQATSPSPGQFPNLRSVSCVSAEWCIAVGEYYFQQNNDALVLLWNGSVWTQASSSVVATTSGNDLEINSVSCVSTSFCTAVGWYNYQPENAGAVHRTLVVSWNGTIWSVVESPNIGNENTELYSVSCVTASSCVAAGIAALATLVLSWNGAVWTPVTSPSPGENGVILNSVSCVTSSSCVAVGFIVADLTFVMSWDGSTWATVPSPNVDPENPADHLSSVSCVNSSWCVAVGETSGPTLIVGIAGTPDTPDTPVDPAAPVVPAFTG